MSENKVIKTTVVADTSAYRKGMQDAAQATEDFGRQAAVTAAPIRTVEAALSGASGAAQASSVKWRQVTGDLQSFQDQMRSAAGAMGAAAMNAAGLSDSVQGVVQSVMLVSAGLGAAAVAVGVVTVAMAAATRETAAMQLALDATSNFAGQTVGSMRDLAVSVAESGKVTVSNAKSLATELASSGKVGQDAFSGVMAAAADFARVTGTEVSKIGPELVKLFEDPAKGAEKLNERMHFLTVAEIEQIKTLQDMGRQTEAQTLLSEKLNAKLATIPENLGTLEKAWRAAGNAASWAWDKMMSAGREKSNLENIQEVAGDIERGTTDGYGGESGARAALARLMKERVAEYAKARDEAAAAEQSALNMKAQAIVRDKSKSYQASEIKSKIALVESQVTGDVTQATQKVETLKALKKDLEDLLKPEKTGTKPKAAQIDDARVVGDWQKRVALLDAEAAGAGKLTEVEKAYVGVLSDITSGKLKMTTAGREKLAVLANEAMAMERAQIDAREMAATQAAVVDAARKETEALQAKVDASRFEVETYGLTQDAVFRLLAARVQERIEMNSFGDANDALIAQLQAQKQAYLDLAASSGKVTPLKDAEKALGELEKAGQRLKESLDLSSLKNAFSGIGAPLAGLIDQFQGLVEVQAEFGRQSALIAKAKQGDADQVARALVVEAALNKKVAMATVGSYANMAGSAKAFFKEGSKGYKALEGAETAFRVAQLAMAVKSAVEQIGLIGGVTAAKVMGDEVSVASSIAATEAELYQAWLRGQANATTAITVQASGGDPYSAFVRMAAMAAAMAALGFSVAGGGGASVNAQSAAVMQEKNGTGTVLGDAQAKSESIAKAMESLADVDTLTMRYSAEMAASLKNIELSMGGLASILVRTYGLTTGNATGQNTYAIGATDIGAQIISGLDAVTLGMFHSILGPLSSMWGGTKVSLIDSGVQFDKGTIGDYVAGNGVSQYGTVETRKKSWFGLSKSTSTNVTNTELPEEVARQFGLIFGNLGDTLDTASKSLGLTTADIGAAVNAFAVDMSRLSLKDMTGEQVQEALGNFFSATFDRVAAEVLPGLEDWQQVGEGYYETVIRVATAVDQASYYTDRLGISMSKLGDVTARQGDVTAELLRASIAAVEGHSGLAVLVQGLSGTAEEIFGTYQSLVDLQRSLRAVVGSSAEVTAGLLRAAGGLDALKSNIEGYYEAYFSDAERNARSMEELRVSLSAVGLAVPSTKAAFRAIVEGVDLTTVAGQRQFATLMEMAGKFADIQQEIVSVSEPEDNTNAVMDALTKAREGLIASYQSEMSALESTVSKFRQFSSSLRQFRDSLALGSLSPYSPGERYAEAARQFEENYSAAMTGDEAALGKLQTVAQSFLEASRIYNASGTGYINDFVKVRDALARASISADATADVAKVQLDVARSQLSALGQIDSGVKTVAQAMAGLSTAVMAAVQAGLNPGAGSVGALTGGVQGEWVTTGSGQNVYQSAGGAAGLMTDTGYMAYGVNGSSLSGEAMRSYVNSLLAAGQQGKIYDEAKAFGITLAELNEIMGWPAGDAETWARENGLPAFAGGGDHQGGFRVVGERGWEIEATGPARYWSFEQSRQMLAGGDSGLTAEVRALREEMRALRAQQQSETATVIEGLFRAADRNADAVTSARSRDRWSSATWPEMV